MVLQGPQAEAISEIADGATVEIALDTLDNSIILTREDGLTARIYKDGLVVQLLPPRETSREKR